MLRRLTLPPTVIALFFFNDTATTEIYTLSLHDALPISVDGGLQLPVHARRARPGRGQHCHRGRNCVPVRHDARRLPAVRHQVHSGWRVGERGSERGHAGPGNRRRGCQHDGRIRVRSRRNLGCQRLLPALARETMAAPGVSTVVTRRPDGTQPRHLGALGHVSALTYSWANPGGPDQLSCTLQSRERTDSMNPGRICDVVRGARIIWTGKLMEPAETAAGRQVTAVGIGKAGADFNAVFTTWSNQNDAVNQAISRGLRWVNPGIPAGVWLGQQADSGSMTIDGLLNLFTTQGGYTWYVSVTPTGNVLSVYLFPAATLPNVNRVLVAAGPVTRTLGGDVNTIHVRYQSSADTATAATFALTSVTTAGAPALHGAREAHAGLASARPLTPAPRQ